MVNEISSILKLEQLVFDHLPNYGDSIKNQNVEIFFSDGGSYFKAGKNQAERYDRVVALLDASNGLNVKIEIRDRNKPNQSVQPEILIKEHSDNINFLKQRAEYLDAENNKLKDQLALLDKNHKETANALKQT